MQDDPKVPAVPSLSMREIYLPIRAMLDDCVEAEKRLQQDSSQFFRRAAVRSFMAAVEGVTWQLKQVCLTAAERGAEFGVGEMAMLLEHGYELDKKGEVRVTARYPKAEPNIRFAFAMAHRTLAPSGDLPDYSCDGWNAMLDLIWVRHRLVHPKSPGDLDVTDQEADRLKVGVGWFVGTVANFLDCCRRASWTASADGASASAPPTP